MQLQNRFHFDNYTNDNNANRYINNDNKNSKRKMTYTPLILFGLGLFGVLFHNLIKLNSINRKNKGIVNISEYFALERFTIAISICFIGFLIVVKNEFTAVEYINKWIGTCFGLAGYLAQSLIVSFTSTTEAFIKNKMDSINEG